MNQLLLWTGEFFSGWEERSNCTLVGAGRCGSGKEPQPPRRCTLATYWTLGRLWLRGSCLTITTSDSTHLAFTPSQLQNLAGGVCVVQSNSSATSFLKVSLAPASRYTSACSLCRDPLP
jgi:hypothetical protein